MNCATTSLSVTHYVGYCGFLLQPLILLYCMSVSLCSVCFLCLQEHQDRAFAMRWSLYKPAFSIQVFCLLSHLPTWGDGGGRAALDHSEPEWECCCWGSAWPNQFLPRVFVGQQRPHRTLPSPCTRIQQVRTLDSWKLWSSPSSTQSSPTPFLKVSVIQILLINQTILDLCCHVQIHWVLTHSFCLGSFVTLSRFQLTEQTGAQLQFHI